MTRQMSLALALAALAVPTAGQTVESVQKPAPASPPAVAAQPARSEFPKVHLTAGRSTVQSTDFDVTRVAVTNPAIADVVVVQPREMLIDGKAPGTVSLIVWGIGRREQYDLVVEPPVTNLEQQLRALFPAEDIHVNVSDEAIILSGQVSNNQVMLRTGEIAQASSSKLKVVNMLQLPGGATSQQVMLQVRFAEVNRRTLAERGVSFFTSGIGFKDTWARSTTGQFAAPGFEDLQVTKADDELASVSGKLSFSDFLNLFVLSAKYDIGAVIRALDQTGAFQSLAEPNLIAYNGQEASFLAGGEFPVPVVQGATGTVTIQWKEFGVRLSFVPTIAGDTIRLRVRPEVSSLDFASGLTLSGFRVPALTARRAETEVELRDGQSFAIAGLLDNVAQDDQAAIPILSQIPIIGYLFKSKATRAARTELMVLITPRLVQPLNPDEVPPLPTAPQKFLPPGKDVGEHMNGGGGAVDAPPVTAPVPAKQKK
jgi:pilus assembly protein CpaC